jgi:hypothetical protein
MDIKRVINFCQNVSLNEKHFHTKENRSKYYILADSILGKMGEEGVREHFHKFDFDVVLDYAFYKDRNDGGKDIKYYWDNDDLYETSLNIDIKANASNAKWLLVESVKFNADVYILCCISNIPRITELRKNPLSILQYKYQCKVIGYAYPEDFTDKFRRGDSLYDPNDKSKNIARLDAYENFGIPTKDLRTNWKDLIKSIKSRSSIAEISSNYDIIDDCLINKDI